MTVDQVAVAVEIVESGGQWWAKSGPYRGVMQIDPRWARVPASWLWIPDVNRAEGRRLLRFWYGKSGHDWAFALAAYNCGWAGLRGRCGVAYARKVLALLVITIALCACDPNKPAPPTPDAIDVYEVVNPYGDGEVP